MAGAALLVAVFGARPALAQSPTVAPKLSPVETMLALRAGTFEVWQDTTRLGTEFYSAYVTAHRDTAVISSLITYDLHSGKALMHYEKRTLRLASVLDNHLFLYQAQEDVGQGERAFSLTTLDTLATIYREANGHGEGDVFAIPRARLYVLDSSTYEQVEWMMRDFMESQLPQRKVQTIIPVRDTVIDIQLVRGFKEKVQGPGGKSIQALHIDIFDDMTKIQAWMDDQGNLVRLEAPAQRVRVLRLPPGDAEAQALAKSAGPANRTTAPSRR